MLHNMCKQLLIENILSRIYKAETYVTFPELEENNQSPQIQEAKP